MGKKLTAAVAAIALTATTLVAIVPADAQWRGRGGHHHHHHRGGGWGGGGAVLGGLAAGAIIGGALASQNRGYYYDDGYAYRPGYRSGGYAVNRDDAYCFQRFKSYDPASGTYLGYDGRRHPCP